MSSSLLTFLKYVFLAVLYLFFLRTLRAVWAELRDPADAADRHVDDGSVEPVPSPPVARLQPVQELRILGPDRVGERHFLGDEVTVGRGSACGLSLTADTFASALHARVFRRNGEYFVEDLGSTNGTFLNGQKVTTPVALRGGDRLQIGKTTLELTG